MVPHQFDDVLVAAPELDSWGWVPTATHFLLEGCGIAIPRELPAEHVGRTREVGEDGFRQYRLFVGEDVAVPPSEKSAIEVQSSVEQRLGSLGWVQQRPYLAKEVVEVAGGPFTEDTTSLMVRSVTMGPVRLNKGRCVAVVRAPLPAESALPTVLGTLQDRGADDPQWAEMRQVRAGAYQPQA